MPFQVLLLEPVVEFLEGLPARLRAKAFRTVQLLREFGPALSQPHAKAVAGQRGLRELRVRLGSDICRLFYFHYRDVICVVTSGYVKKTQKLSGPEVERAVRLMREYLEEQR